MRIAQINAVYGILSTGVTCSQLANWLSHEGIENISGYGCRYNNHRNTIKIGTVWTHRWHALVSRITGKEGHYSYISTLFFLKKLNSFKPDVVHLRNLHESYINLPLLFGYLRRKNIATVITLHDSFFYTGGCTVDAYVRCDNWKKGCSNCKFLNRTSRYWFNINTKKIFTERDKQINSLAKYAIVGVSDWITNEAKESTIFRNAVEIQRIYNWIDLSLFKAQGDKSDFLIKRQLRVEGKKLILGVASGWSDKKGLQDFIKLSTMIDDGTRIVLIGSMPEHINLPSNIILIPKIYNIADLPKYYSAADVFVHLSIEESFGKVTAEAICCGTPVVVYNSTACPELASDGCGYVVKKIGDIDSIAACVRKILSNGKTYYQSACREKAILEFDMEKNCRQYLELYNKLLNT